MLRRFILLLCVSLSLSLVLLFINFEYVFINNEIARNFTNRRKAVVEIEKLIHQKEFANAFYTIQQIEYIHQLTYASGNFADYHEGITLYELGNYEKAKMFFNLVEIQNDVEKYPESLYFLGESYRKKGDNTKAIQYFHRYLKTDGTNKSLVREFLSNSSK